MDVGRRVSSRWYLARGPGTPTCALQVPRENISAQSTLSRVSFCNCGSSKPPEPQMSMTGPDWKASAHFPGPHWDLNSSHPNSEKRPGHHMLLQGQADPGWLPQASWGQRGGPATWKKELVLKFAGLVGVVQAQMQIDTQCTCMGWDKMGQAPNLGSLWGLF